MVYNIEIISWGYQHKRHTFCLKNHWLLKNVTMDSKGLDRTMQNDAQRHFISLLQLIYVGILLESSLQEGSSVLLLTHLCQVDSST